MRLIALPLAAILLLVLPPAPVTAEEETYVATAACAWDKSHLNVLIVPPAPTYLATYEGPTFDIGEDTPIVEPDTDLPWDGRHAQAALEAVEAWERAMHAYAAAHPGASHLADFVLDATILGPDADQDIVRNPDVTVFFTPVQDAGGRTVESCTPTTALAYQSPRDPDAGYMLGGTAIWMNQWFVWSFTPNDTYNVMLHEFGHALGLDHVAFPEGDVLNPVYHHFIGDILNPRECVSTLNLAQLDRSYQWMDGSTPYKRSPPGTAIPASAYAFLCGP